MIRRTVGRWLMRLARLLAPGHMVVLPLYRLGQRLTTENPSAKVES